ncbi:hypothetical protein BC941DRAFT_506875 [Chlamydoabsidia padenii]|nr:hypothetical protein BC941DRAFT_506875 [Chlamydoabsidia padenii]
MNQLAKFVDDCDTFYDLHVSPPLPSPTATSLAPSNSPCPEYNLGSIQHEDHAKRIDLLERHEPSVQGLHGSIVRYLDSITRCSNRPISKSSCVSLASLDIVVYKQLTIEDKDEDMEVTKSFVRTGEKYDDHIKAVSITGPKSSSEHILEKVFVVPDFGTGDVDDFLVNHVSVNVLGPELRQFYLN